MKYKPSPPINDFKYPGTDIGIIVQGEREFHEYLPGCFALFNIRQRKSFRYIQCDKCGKIWATGCGFAKHKCSK